MLQVHQFPCLSDNYGFLLHDPDSGETACIDTPDAAAYLREAEARGWRITQIWNTHWHPDHAGGNEAIKAATGCTITAPAVDAPKIAGVDRAVSDGDTVSLGAWTAQVIDVGGHTMGHIAYHLPDYAAEIERKRAAGEPTVPTKLERELAANPFLRADTPEMRARWGGSSPPETFAALRAAKDTF